MKLEDATKEELVWWIREHSFELRRAMGSFTADVMFHRSRQYNAKAEAAMERYKKALADYRGLLAPYQGKPLSSLPREVIQKGAELERVMTQAQKEQLRCWRAADRCMERMEPGMCRL